MRSSDDNILFTPLRLKNITLANRFIRSATYEGMADADGIVLPDIGRLYRRLADNDAGTIITGFCFISKQGRAMQPSQAGICDERMTQAWAETVKLFRQSNTGAKIFMQLAHTGRQTLSRVTGCEVVGAGNKKCSYFRQKTKPLSDADIETIINDFADAAARAKSAGFDGVQIHAAHGYLIHQFLSPATNSRRDKWGGRNLFLVRILEAVKQTCGSDYPVLVKLSHSDDHSLTIDHTIETINRISGLVDAVEISYGTMELAMNIFRGDCPVDVVMRVNPIFRDMPPLMKWLWKRFAGRFYLHRLKPFTENYNLPASQTIAKNTNVPIISVGGFRALDSMARAVQPGGISAVSLCRPLICEPDLIKKFRLGTAAGSRCTNCNLCAVYCDENSKLRCRKYE